ncbi:MAG: Inositol 2-dehydrogenase/D-chiro-inositol 3-dehydrogenase [Verrucomicrobiae bacterium]|nr:Inositol 2-dehydrogenase/D-chiro-inositol 3-dehydrogenase [Verrucomicrobiae bacterium]
MKRVGLIGAGYVSQFHIKALQRLPDVEIVGVCDLDLARAQATGCRAFGSTKELYAAGVDFVHILTPPASHAALTIEALQHGCHVLVEKPLATSVEDCDRIAAAAGDKIVCVNHSLLRDPFVMQALDLVRNGAVGDILSVDYFRSSDYPPYLGGPLPPQYRDGGYPFRDLGVHALYLMQSFLGNIEDVQGQFRSAGKLSADPNIRYDEWRALVRCTKGTGQIQLSWNVKPIQNQLFIQGTKGTIRADLFSMFVTCRKNTPFPKAIERVLNARGEGKGICRQVRRNVVKFLRGQLMSYHGLQMFIADFYANPRAIVSLTDARQVVDWTERVARPADEAKRQPLPKLTAPVLVTGAGGFIGRQLLKRLLEQHDRVRVFVRRALPADPRVEVVVGDLGDPEVVERAVAGTEIIYHVGAAMRGSREDFERGTVVGTKNILDAMRRHRVKKLVYVSSLSVLHAAAAKPGVKMKEDWPVEPRASERGAYTQTKLAAEKLVRESGLPAVIVRPGQVFGPGTSAVTGAVAQQVGKRKVILGNGQLVLPLVYVDDVVDAILLAAKKETGLWHVVDTGVQITQEQLAPGAMKLPYPLVYVLAWTAELLLKRRAPLTRYRLKSALAPIAFDCGAAEKELGWKPRVGVVEGLKRERSII